MNKKRSDKEIKPHEKRLLEEQTLQFLESMAATIQKRRQNISIPEPEVLIRQMREMQTTAFRRAASEHQSDAGESRTTTK